MRLYGVTGWKNTGKTGLVERLVAYGCARWTEFSQQGLGATFVLIDFTEEE